MNFKHFFKQFITLLIVLVSIFSGCAVITTTIPDQQQNRVIYEKSYNATWDAVMLAIGNIPLEIVEKSNGYIKTGWIEKRSDKDSSGLFFDKPWKQRDRLIITLTSMSSFDARTEVSFMVHSEQKAPGGLQGQKWQRKASDSSYAYDFFNQVENFFLEEQ